MLFAENLNFAYPGTSPILQSINLRLEQGEIVVITGDTGSGKSTLAKCLTGLIPQSIPGDFSGKILIDEENIAEHSLATISRLVSMVQQDTDSQICTLTVVDEVAFGPENFQMDPLEIAKIVDHSLEQLHSTHLKDRTTTQLSGGERQRIVISSVLACQPKYLILDEPTSSLDPAGVSKLQETLVKLKESGLGILIFEHRLHAVSTIADQILHLKDGKLSTRKSGQVQLSKVSDIPEPSERKILTASRVFFSYDTSPIIKNINLSISEGELIALMGDNGSGKSTLLALLGGLLTPSSGEIRLGSNQISELNARDLATQIASISQNPNHQIFERTVWKEQILTSNIIDSENSSYLDISEEYLKRVQLENMKERNPFSLSHGQKRRLNVTSVIAHKPLLYLFDEPFIGQDNEGKMFVIETLVDRARNAGACVIATHDSDFARTYCNRLVFLENGTILFDGKPFQVLKKLKEIGRNEYFVGGAG
jgi:energy-coupling factor transporter ATP-binding protein EcfA2